MTTMSDRFEIESYDESTDSYTLRTESLNYPEVTFTVPGFVLPVLTGEYGEPENFIGSTYELNLPITKCNDSDTRSVTCPNCGEVFDGELREDEEGDEECTHCEAVFFIEAFETQPEKESIRFKPS